MSKLIPFFISISIVFSHNALALENSTDIKTVISEGVGLDPQSAAQNAAENALKNVVGSFIDTNTLLEKRTVINDGIKSETKKISNDVKEYSQGSIKSFETLEIKQESNLYKVTAKVTVRNEDFAIYVKKLASGATQIDGTGMFANIANKSTQLDNLTSIVYEKITKPINSGQVQEFEVGKPVLFSDFIKNVPSFNNVLHYSEYKQNDSTIVFKVKTYLKSEFSKNIVDVLEKISTGHEMLNLLDSNKCSGEKFCIKKERDSKTGITDVFTLDLKYNNYKESDNSNMKVVIFDSKKEPIFMESVTHYSELQHFRYNPYDKSKVHILVNEADYNYQSYRNSRNDDSYYPQRSPAPWSLLRHDEQNAKVILESMSFFVIVKLEPDILSKADKVVVSLGDYSNPNTVLSEYRSQSNENLKNTEKLENNLKSETPKSEKSEKQLQ
jgi:hypothetical protein